MDQRILKDFPQSTAGWIPSLYLLKNTRQSASEPYLIWKNRSNEFKVCWDPPAPKQYFRTVIAEAIGCPEKADYRNIDPEEDKRLCLETVERLKPHLS